MLRISNVCAMQDAPLWPNILPNTMITAWIPFDDVVAETGAMWMLPGSHRWGDQIEEVKARQEGLPVSSGSGAAGLTSTSKSERPVFTLEGFGDLPMDDFAPLQGGPSPVARPCPVAKGQVHFHHSLTWHGSPSNTSVRRRRAIGIHYMPAETRCVVQNLDGPIYCPSHLLWNILTIGLTSR
jgi:ectoine hydroxylase-related dioxygenase (phytanoyl-CoA dioxygenase family)